MNTVPKGLEADPSISVLELKKEQSPQIPKPARKSKIQFRHFGILLSLLLIFVVPTIYVGHYLYNRALDQFSSTVSFSVRSAESRSPIEILGGITDLAGSASSDADVLNDYLSSMELVQDLQDRINLRDIYAGNSNDPYFSFDQAGVIEDLSDHWDRMTRIRYDTGTGIIELRALAFSAEEAQLITQQAFDLSSEMVNRLSAIAQEDAMRYATIELAEARELLTSAREQLTLFRAKSQIVDPEADIQSQIGLLGSLQSALAEELIELKVLESITRTGDHRLDSARSRIEVIREQIDLERAKFGAGEPSSEAGSYAEVVAEFERLTVDRELAEQNYAVALASFQAAQADSRRQSRYLAAHVRPTLAQKAEYPLRLEYLIGIASILFVIWATLALIYYAVRDRG